VILLNLGVVAMKQGDLAHARTRYAECVPMLQQSGYRWALLMVIEMFAVLSGRLGNAKRSVVLAGAAAGVRDQTGSPAPPHGEVMVGQALERA
jgi:hypothetical protein